MSESKKSLSEQLAELDDLVAWFNQPDIDLDEALKKFDYSVDMIKKIKQQLAEAENKITILKKRFNEAA